MNNVILDVKTTTQHSMHKLINLTVIDENNNTLYLENNQIYTEIIKHAENKNEYFYYMHNLLNNTNELKTFSRFSESINTLYVLDDEDILKKVLNNFFNNLNAQIQIIHDNKFGEIDLFLNYLDPINKAKISNFIDIKSTLFFLSEKDMYSAYKQNYEFAKSKDDTPLLVDLNSFTHAIFIKNFFNYLSNL